MLHDSTQKLIAKLAELTERGELDWKEGEGRSSLFESEGYSVSINADPPSFRVLDAKGRELEHANAADLAAARWPQGEGDYAQAVAVMAKRAHRIASGAERAIASLLTALSAPANKPKVDIRAALKSEPEPEPAPLQLQPPPAPVAPPQPNPAPAPQPVQLVAPQPQPAPAPPPQPAPQQAAPRPLPFAPPSPIVMKPQPAPQPAPAPQPVIQAAPPPPKPQPTAPVIDPSRNAPPQAPSSQPRQLFGGISGFSGKSEPPAPRPAAPPPKPAAAPVPPVSSAPPPAAAAPTPTPAPAAPAPAAAAPAAPRHPPGLGITGFSAVSRQTINGDDGSDLPPRAASDPYKPWG